MTGDFVRSLTTYPLSSWQRSWKAIVSDGWYKHNEKRSAKFHFYLLASWAPLSSVAITECQTDWLQSEIHPFSFPPSFWSFFLWSGGGSGSVALIVLLLSVVPIFFIFQWQRLFSGLDLFYFLKLETENMSSIAEKQYFNITILRFEGKCKFSVWFTSYT